jgi:hypothetical protein
MDARNRAEIRKILFRLKRAYENEQGAAVSDAAFSGRMGITPSVYNGYKKGHNVPGPDNSRLIGSWVARYLGEVERKKFMELCGHDAELRKIEGLDLAYIVEHWEDVPMEKRREIYDQVAQRDKAGP